MARNEKFSHTVKSQTANSWFKVTVIVTRNSVKVVGRGGAVDPLTVEAKGVSECGMRTLIEFAATSLIGAGDDVRQAFDIALRESKTVRV